MISAFAKTLASVLVVASLSSLTLATSNDTILRSCLNLSGNPTSYPDVNTTTWANETSAWQLRIQPSPAAVTYPTTSSQIASILSCAYQSSTKVACLNGGHSYGAYGLGGNDDALIINMENFKSVSLDEETGFFTYGGGSIVGEAATWLWENHGLYFPHVRANRVGLAGSSIGGGFGSTSRFLGTPMDNLESVEYMLYNGTILNCSRTENSDLFWVAQGAGSSYGVLLSLTTKTWKPEFEQVTNYTITLTDSSFETGINALLSIQDHALNECPDTLSMRWSLTATPYTGSGFYYGDPTNFTSAISPLLERLGDTATLTTSVSSFWDMENIATPGLNTTIETYPARNFYLQALTLQEDKPLTYASASALYNFTTLAFNRTDLTKFGFLDLWGGVSRDIKDTDTSFAHANNLWLIRWEGRLATGLTAFPADGISHMQEGFKPFQDQLAVEGIPLRGFVNYRDTELTVEEWSARLYGDNFARMQEIKASVDPTAMFTTNPQSISLP